MEVLVERPTKALGAFDSVKSTYSPGTAALLKDLLLESGTSVDARQQFYRDLQRKSQLKPTDAALKDKKGRSLSVSSADGKRDRIGSNVGTMLRKRSLQQICAKLKAEPQLQYCPPFPKYNQESKERCQDLMSGIAMAKIARKRCEQQQPEPKNTPESDETILKAKTEQTCKEIKERVTWLREMQQLRAVTADEASIINAQLATRLRFLQSSA